MKKITLKLFVVLVMVSVAMTVFTSCGPNDGSGDPNDGSGEPDMEKLVGTWKNKDGKEYTFNSDGTYTFDGGGPQQNGEYSVSGDRITLKESFTEDGQKGDQTSTYSMIVTDTEFALVTFNGGDTKTLVGEWKRYFFVELKYTDKTITSLIEATLKINEDYTFNETTKSSDGVNEHTEEFSGKWKYEDGKLISTYENGNESTKFVYVTGNGLIIGESLDETQDRVYKKQ